MEFYCHLSQLLLNDGVFAKESTIACCDVWSLHVDDENADTSVFFGSIGVCSNSNPAVVSLTGKADEGFLSVYSEVITVCHSVGLQRGEVGARLRLGIRQAKHELSA